MTPYVVAPDRVVLEGEAVVARRSRCRHRLRNGCCGIMTWTNCRSSSRPVPLKPTSSMVRFCTSVRASCEKVTVAPLAAEIVAPEDSSPCTDRLYVPLASEIVSPAPALRIALASSLLLETEIIATDTVPPSSPKIAASRLQHVFRRVASPEITKMPAQQYAAPCTTILNYYSSKRIGRAAHSLRAYGSCRACTRSAHGARR